MLLSPHPLPYFALCDVCATVIQLGDWPFCPHGPWRGTELALIDDSIPGGMTIENMGPEPLTFYSHQAHREAMKARGLVPFVRHVGTPGSDKSPYTTRWT